ncbi:tail fiber domain-containing protein [Telmatospirillum sp.]|uniref:tail fiber domain-containing protein n=1 Tax=Telmatospirillum sp. TaxID=2079197 RepID=UPI002846D455|nr:tail fiber domain-containing protein [Telmatospirillum sp.]MDR3438192.1 tail fiber domain-containing protein [Telmatospirillum sp.]
MVSGIMIECAEKQSRAARRRRSQAGVIGLTDAMLGLAVTAIALPGVIGIINQQTRETQNQVAAQQLRAVGEATRGYVRDHFAALYAGIQNRSLDGDFLEIGDLAATGYLPASFATKNPFKQRTVVLLRIVADTSPTCPTPNLSQIPDGIHCKALLEAMVMTTGGTALDPARASHVAVSAGASAGMVADAGTARGSYGSWCEDLALFGGPTHSTSCPPDARASLGNAFASARYNYGAPAQGGLAMGMFFNGSELLSEYLNRFNTGNPEDNTMHANLTMDDNEIRDVKTVQIHGVDQGLEAARMGMVNDLFGGTYTGNTTAPGTLTVANLVADGKASAPGNITAAGSVTAKQTYSTVYYHSSDAALKTNIRPIDDPLGLVGRLRGHRFQWKADGSADVGFVAQEVRTVLPEAVGQAPNGSLTVKYDIIAAPLVEAVKALSGRIDQLEEEKRRSSSAGENNP